MLEGMDDADVIVTSYPLLRRDLDTYLGRTFHTLILDEAQAIKNASSQTAQAVKQIQAPRRFALTGTPVENSLDELWSIFEAVFPGLFQVIADSGICLLNGSREWSVRLFSAV